MAGKRQLADTFRSLGKVDSQTLFGQHVLDDIRPFNDDNYLRVADDFRQLIGYHAGFVQAVKIKMVDLEIIGLVDFADSKCWAGDFILGTCAAGQAAHKGGFAAAEVAD